jgi:hypothetical protein
LLLGVVAVRGCLTLAGCPAGVSPG